MNYQEQLAKAKELNLSIIDLHIADEVACQFGADHPRFEDICERVWDMYKDTDHVSIDDLAYCLYACSEDGTIDLDKALDGEDEDAINKVIDMACNINC